MEFKNCKFEVEYIYNNQNFVITKSDDLLKIDFHYTENDFLKIDFVAMKEIQLIKTSVCFDYDYDKNEKFFANGYQSWTTSREYGYGDSQEGLLGPCKIKALSRYTSYSGDYNFARYGKNLYHSFTYTYLKNEDKNCLIASLSDKIAYTVFYADYENKILSIEKDVEGMIFVGKKTIFNIKFYNSGYEENFDKWFEDMEIAKPKIKHLAGYTSWYNYYQNIDEKIINRDIDGLEKAGKNANIFQIDDGYESFVGDWKIVDKNKFPNGLKPIVEKIHKNGKMAGLWLAPFAGQKDSKLFKEHKDWFLKENGKYVLGGVNWNLWYVLDIDNNAVRSYIKSCFDKIFDVWNFDMVKLDFLYSICMKPRCGKSRGQLMFEAMEFLRECCRDKLILGCGVPLAPAFGVVDACRISSDVENSFEDKWYAKLTNQECISAKNAMNNTIFRRHLNNRAFINDPDVFFLRNDGAVVPKYSWEQKKLLAKINHLFGDVLFVSDNINNYNKKQLGLLKKAYEKFEGKILDANYIDKKTIEILFEEEEKNKKLCYDIYTGKFTIEEQDGNIEK